MRLIILTIFAICMAGTVKAQTDFDFTCELTCSDATAAIAAIPDAMMDDPNGPLYDRVEYINNIPTPDGFGIDANDEKIRIYEGTDSDSGNQVWPWNDDFNAYSYEDFNKLYRMIHRILINLEYGCDILEGT